MEPVPAIVLWPATNRTRPSSPPPSPGNEKQSSEALPSTPPLRSGLNQRGDWIVNPDSPFFSRHNVAPMTPPMSPEDFKFKGTTTSPGRTSPPSRYPLTMGYDSGPSTPEINSPTGSHFGNLNVEAGRRSSVEALKESSSMFMRRMFPSSMLGLSFDGAGSAVAEKRKIQAKEARGSISHPLSMKWRYKRVWRKRALMLLVFTVALYQFYKAFEFNGVDLARVPGSWLGGSSDKAGEPSSKYMRSTMEKKTSNSNPTGRANAPLSSKSKSKKQQRVKSSASKGSLHPISKGVLAVDTSLPVTAHPVVQLTEHAQKEWDAKVARQSKTLLQAVNEYKKRNRGRAPPKGFDKWWKLVKSVALYFP